MTISEAAGKGTGSRNCLRTRTNSRRLESWGRAAVFRQTPAVLVRVQVL